MIHLTRSLIRRWLSALLHIQDTPQRTAAAFALGVFFGFSPFLGLHTVMALALAFPAQGVAGHPPQDSPFHAPSTHQARRGGLISVKPRCCGAGLMRA